MLNKRSGEYPDESLDEGPDEGSDKRPEEGQRNEKARRARTTASIDALSFLRARKIIQESSRSMSKNLTLTCTESDAVRTGFRDTEYILVDFNALVGFPSNHVHIGLFRE